MNRRSFIKSASLGALASQAAASAAQARQGDGGGRAKNVILLIGDGLDMGGLAIAQLYSRRKLNRNLHWIDWLASGGARRSALATDCADRIVTDSAAAASAWSIGEVVNHGALSMTPDGRRPTPLLVRAKQSGMRTGAMTTTFVADATTASMFANAPSRSNIESIVPQMIAAQPDLVLGGGGRHFPDEIFAGEQSTRVVRDHSQLNDAMWSEESVFALLEDGDLPLEIERPERHPSFLDLVRSATSMMTASDDPFMLVIESEHIDTSTHMNDAPTMMREIVIWDEALKHCLDLCKSRNDTLFIVASDHANCAPAFARNHQDADECFERLCACPHSHLWFRRQYRDRGDDPDAVDLIALAEEAFGVRITEQERDTIATWMQGGVVDPYEDRNGYYAPLGSVLGNHFGVAFATYHHTTNHVEALSTGPGSETMPAYGHLTDVHSTITRALGWAT